MIGAASATGDDLSAGDADMDADATAYPSRHVGYRGAYGQRCTNGSFGIITARRGWLEASDILNTLPLPQFTQAIRRS